MNILKRCALLGALLGAVVLTACGGGGDDAAPLLIVTANGQVQGKAADGTRQFLGLPYAAPPIGALRWKPPASAANFTQTWDATKFAPHCPQKASSFGVASTTEDCLYLNVFAPAQPGKYPVMVWYHGGGMARGESNDFDATRLTKEGVIVVTLNYRIGALGFLAHPALTAESGTNSSGNYGLMDQQAALEWVQRNIAAFDGDPDNVTIFGQSAGALGVLSQIASPSAAGLFHKAITQSPYALDTLALSFGEFFGTQVATAAGCPAPQTAECLRNLTVEQVLQFQAPSYVPVVDGDVLPQTIRAAFTAGEVNKVPVIQGSTANEYTLLSASAYDLSAAGPTNAGNYVTRQGSALTAAVSSKTVPEVDAVYPLANFATHTDALDAIAGDAIVSCPTRDSLQLLSAHTPVYGYEFNDPDAPMGFLPPATRDEWGAFHASDLQYLFDIIDPPQTPAPFTAAQQALSDRMIDLWTQFAKTGNPNAPGTSLWPAYTAASDTFLSLEPGGASHATDQFTARHHCAFWSGS